MQILWNKQKKEAGNKMTVDEYVNLMMDAAVDAKLVLVHSHAATHTPSLRLCVVTPLTLPPFITV